LDDSALRFVPLRDERGEGLRSVTVRRRAASRTGEEVVELCGTRFRLS
jgi:hypothetical protein